MKVIAQLPRVGREAFRIGGREANHDWPRRSRWSRLLDSFHHHVRVGSSTAKTADPRQWQSPLLEDRPRRELLRDPKRRLRQSNLWVDLIDVESGNELAML